MLQKKLNSRQNYIKKKNPKNERADRIYKRNPEVFDRRKQGGLDQIAS